MSNRRNVLELFEEQKEWMQEIVQAGIEQHRKGYAKITIMDGKGNPIPDAKICLNQKTHEFRFGANLFLLDEMETKEKNEAYKKIFAETFNMATLPFYWDSTEPQKGQLRYAKDSKPLYRRPAIDLCMDYCEANGIEPREHALAFEYFFPKWLWGADTPTVKRELERRYKEISERYADRIPTIEVTNEMEHPQGRTAFYDESDYIEWCFKMAEKYFPANQLGINEHTVLPWEDCCRPTDKYYSYIEANLLKGARIDAIGMQYHIFKRREDEYDQTRLRYNPKSLYAHLDLYSNFGKPIQVTEITIPCYSADPEDEAIQAEIIEYLYSLWFSHPSVEQIIYWNLVDGYAHVWDPDPEKIKASQGNMSLGENYYYGGLLRFDMSPKPAYHKVKELLWERWHTQEELTADAGGKAQFKGFYGEYELEIEAQGKKEIRKINLSKKGTDTFEIVL